MFKNLVEQDNLQVSKVNYKDSWNHYKGEVKKNSKGTKINSQADHTRIIKDCFKTISNYWTESTGGVYVAGAGYFTFLRPIKKLQVESRRDYINNAYRTNGYSYLLTHISTLKPSDNFAGFKLRRPTDKIKQTARKNIIKGKRYTINSILIREYIKRKTYL